MRGQRDFSRGTDRSRGIVRIGAWAIRADESWEIVTPKPQNKDPT
jgi:hypothetical protein